jgi:hypothetical protein
MSPCSAWEKSLGLPGRRRQGGIQAWLSPSASGFLQRPSSTLGQLLGPAAYRLPMNSDAPGHFRLGHSCRSSWAAAKRFSSNFSKSRCTLQSNRQADRIAKNGHSYAEQEAYSHYAFESVTAARLSSASV